VSRGQRSNGRTALVPRARASDRGRVLLVDEQHPARHDQAGEAGTEAVPVELLVAFTRRLVQSTVSQDQLLLSIWGACSDLGIERAEGQRLLLAVLREHDVNGVWPKGF